MASFNNGHLIATAVESVMAQTHTAWELIIVDDSSTDNSVAIAESFAAQDQRIHLFQNDRNYGVGYTKRRAVDECRGVYVAVLDPDDAITPDAIAVMRKTQIENPSASLCWSEHFVCDERFNVFEKSNSTFRGDEKMGYLSPHSGGIHHFWCFKRDAYYRTNGFGPWLRLAEDQDLFYKLEEVGGTFHISNRLYYYRHHADSISIGDKTAAAYGYHLIVMCEALKRRKSLLPSEIWKQQFQVVCKRYDNFVEWGATEIDLLLAVRIQWSITSIVQSGWAQSVLGKALRYRLKQAFNGRFSLPR